MSELRREKLKNALLGNAGSLTEAMRIAGYGPGYVKNPQDLKKTNWYMKEIDPIVQMMKDEREAALKEMIKKRDEARYSDLSGAIDKLTKNIQLMSGGETENIKAEHSIKWEE